MKIFLSLMIFMMSALPAESPKLSLDQVKKLATARSKQLLDENAYVSRYAQYKQKQEDLTKEFEADFVKLQAQRTKSSDSIKIMVIEILKEVKCEGCTITENFELEPKTTTK